MNSGGLGSYRRENDEGRGAGVRGYVGGRARFAIKQKKIQKKKEEKKKERTSDTRRREKARPKERTSRGHQPPKEGHGVSSGHTSPMLNKGARPLFT